jgi:hypothetical protein
MMPKIIQNMPIKLRPPESRLRAIEKMEENISNINPNIKSLSLFR